MRSLQIVPLLIGIFLLSVGYAQEVQFIGIVKDIHGHSIPGAHVQVHPGKKIVVTDAKGVFSFQKTEGEKVFIEIAFWGLIP